MTQRTDSPRRAPRLATMLALAAGLAAAPAALAVPQATLDIDSANGPLETSSSCCFGAWKITNQSTQGESITKVVIDAANGPAVFPDIVFDPDDGTPAGDTASWTYQQTAQTGGVSSSGSHPPASANGGGFDQLEIATSNFGPTDTLTFAIDMDPTSIQGSNPSASAGHISGTELHGATVTVTFSNGAVLSADVIGDPQPAVPDWKGRAVVRPDVSGAPGLSRAGGGSSPARVGVASQSLVVSGALAGTTGVVLVAEGNMSVEVAPGGGFDIEPFEANKAKNFQEVPFTIGAGGTATVPVTLTRTADGLARPDSLGLNYITAYFNGPAGSARVSDPIVLQLDPSVESTPPAITGRQPAPGASGVNRDADVIVTFSEPIDPGTASAGITLAPASGGAPVPAVVSTAGATATLDPVGSLAANTAYRASVAASVADPAGNQLGAASSWTFTTGTAGGGGSQVPASSVCRRLPAVAAPAGGRGRISLSVRQMRINQRIAAAAIRRANAIERWLNGGIERRDICGTSLLPQSFAGVDFGTGGPQTAGAAPNPRPLRIAVAGQASGRLTLSVKQLRINQAISAAAVRRSNALNRRIDALTGGDVEDGAIALGQLVPGTTILSAPPPALTPSRSVTRVAAPKPGSGRFRVSVAQLRIEQRISAAAVRRLNAIQRQIEAGLTSANFVPGGLTAADLDPGLRT